MASNHISVALEFRNSYDFFLSVMGCIEFLFALYVGLCKINHFRNFRLSESKTHKNSRCASKRNMISILSIIFFSGCLIFEPLLPICQNQFVAPTRVFFNDLNTGFIVVSLTWYEFDLIKIHRYNPDTIKKMKACFKVFSMFILAIPAIFYVYTIFSGQGLRYWMNSTRHLFSSLCLFAAFPYMVFYGAHTINEFTSLIKKQNQTKREKKAQKRAQRNLVWLYINMIICGFTCFFISFGMLIDALIDSLRPYDIDLCIYKTCPSVLNRLYNIGRRSSKYFLCGFFIYQNWIASCNPENESQNKRKKELVQKLSKPEESKTKSDVSSGSCSTSEEECADCEKIEQKE